MEEYLTLLLKKMQLHHQLILLSHLIGQILKKLQEEELLKIHRSFIFLTTKEWNLQVRLHKKLNGVQLNERYI